MMDKTLDAERLRAELKSRISSNTGQVNPKHCVLKLVDTTKFLFCSGDANPIQVQDGDRRFRVVYTGIPK